MRKTKDWSLATAALETMPPGTWTTFGEIARLEGTSAQAVASWVSSKAPHRRAYRILNREGRVPDGFQWNAANRGEERNPVNVLGFDGVRIGLDGRADPAQRLDLGDLRSLVERSAP